MTRRELFPILNCSDIQATRAFYQAGAAIPMRPQAMPWGETVAYVQDPEGTMLLVIQAEPDTES